MDNKEILEKLRELSDLLDQFLQKHDYYENGCAAEALEKIELVKNSVETMPGVPSVVNAMPVFPIGETEYQKAKTETAQSGKITMIALIVTAAFAILWLITKSMFLGFIGVTAGFVAYWLNKNHKNNKLGLAKKEKAYNESVAASNSSIENFRKALSSYDQEVTDGIAAAKNFGQFYREKTAEHTAILDEFSENQDKALMECSLLSVEIDEHDYIPKEYYHHIPKLISLLQSGRADSYKEALNMAIEEERQDAMEAARQEEEARRLAAMERQAEEERRHNMMMERQQAAQERAQQYAAQKQADAEKRAAQKAEQERKAAGFRKCINCANKTKCNIYVQESGAGLTCGAYRPR